LIDYQGKVLKQQTGRGGEVVEVSIADFANGAYVIQAIQGSRREQVKMVKE
jgi:hypothetical protein